MRCPDMRTIERPNMTAKSHVTTSSLLSLFDYSCHFSRKQTTNQCDQKAGKRKMRKAMGLETIKQGEQKVAVKEQTIPKKEQNLEL